MQRKKSMLSVVLFNMLISGTLLLNSGCYNYRISTHAQTGSEAMQGTIHTFFWGLLRNPENGLSTPNCDSLGVNGMSEVTYKHNFGFSLINVATLGIWAPARVEWRCSKPCQKIEPL